MLDISTPEFHHLFRILSKRVVLWTAMHVDETLAFTDDLDRHLQLASPELHPIVCQIGGRSPEHTTKACRSIGCAAVGNRRRIGVALGFEAQLAVGIDGRAVADRRPGIGLDDI